MWLRCSVKAAYVTEEQTDDSCFRDMFSRSKNKEITNPFDNFTSQIDRATISLTSGTRNISIAFCYLKAPTERC